MKLSSGCIFEGRIGSVPLLFGSLEEAVKDSLINMWAYQTRSRRAALDADIVVAIELELPTVVDSVDVLQRPDAADEPPSVGSSLV